MISRNLQTLNKWSMVLFVLLFPCLVVSCGYQIERFDSVQAGEGTSVPTSIAIPIFANATTEPNLEFFITNALREEFMKKGGIRVVSGDQADAVILGRLIKIYASDVTHDAVKHTTETRVYVTMDIRCEDAQTGKIIWQDNQFTYYEEYVRTGDAFIDYDRRQAAMEYLSKQVAERIYDRFVHRF